jgi:hypothetical protein
VDNSQRTINRLSSLFHPTTAIMGFNFVTGFVFVMAYFIMANIPKTAHLAAKLVYLFRIFPSYDVGEGLIAISTLYFRWYFWGKSY